MNKKLLAFCLILALCLSLMPVYALAAKDKDGEDAEAETAEALEVVDDAEEMPLAESDEALEEVFVVEGEEYYNNGLLVYNNGGIVYNNGGEVYNNAGVVYNNKGVVFNNGGTVYNNRGTVYENDGDIYNNDGEILSPDVLKEVNITLPEDIDSYAVVTGLEEKENGGYILAKDGIITVEALPGYEIIELSAGSIKADEYDGVFTLSELTEDATLSIKLRLAAPEMSLASGTYAEEQKLTLTAVEGAEIYFTIDGSEPSVDSTRYKAPMSIDKSMSVKAIAVMDGFKDSAVVSAEYAFLEVTAPKFLAIKEGYEEIEPEAIEFYNKGKINAVVAGVELGGEDPEVFILSTTDGGMIKAGGKDITTWTLQPKTELEVGSYKLNVIITYDSGESIELPINFRVT